MKWKGRPRALAIPSLTSVVLPTPAGPWILSTFPAALGFASQADTN